MSQEASNRPRSALADGAERMNVLSRTVREQQLAERGALRFPVMDVYSMSPDEAWSKKFMSQGIGPAPDCASPGGFCPIPFASPAAAPQSPRACDAPPLAESHVQALPAPADPLSTGYQQIGQAIGKPLRRSWFRRGSP
jgi:hypothetical protein